MKISVNAPSYRRSGDVRTLNYLPFCKIWVDEEEAEEYRKNYPKAEIIACPKGIQGNLCRVRNYILRNEFENGCDVVVIVDDDLTSVNGFEKDRDTNYGYVSKPIETDEFLLFVEKYSFMAEEIGAKFWGMNCNQDARAYNHMTPFSTVSYIGGPFQAFLKGNRCFYDERLPLKEDYDMTIQQLNVERVVFRVNKYHYRCLQSKNAGGCATYRNREREAEQFDMLQRKWGSKIVKRDRNERKKTDKGRQVDYNPIILIPIKGV